MIGINAVPDNTVRDRFWIWGHPAHSHDAEWNLPGTSRMTAAEGALYLDVPNMLMVTYNGEPKPPYDQLAIALRPLKRIVWSIVGAGSLTEAAERDAAIELATRFPNITGMMMDDFFNETDADGKPGTLSVSQLSEIREKLVLADRSLDLWTVLYRHQLEMSVQEHLDMCEVLTCWTWWAKDLVDLEATFERFEAVSPNTRKVLGCYLWDYGDKQQVPIELMQHQCELGLRWLREGRIEGMIFLASCVCDLELPAVEWTRRWIAEVGDEVL